LPDTLLESELFGYEKGAFTGAANRKPGRVELAHRGTLFLDEIGDISPQVQVKLLRVLQEREFERVGGTQTIKVDVRFVAATHRDLDALVAKGEFREDLYYRLNVVTLRVPPLRERGEDIEVLAEHFLRVLGAANGKRELALDRAGLQVLRAYSWPGNVRQLQNVMERLVVLGDGPILGKADVERELSSFPGTSSRGLGFGGMGFGGLGVEGPSGSAGPRASWAPRTGFGLLGSGLPGSGLLGSGDSTNDGNTEPSLETHRREAEREALLRALGRAGNNRTQAARLLNVSRRTLYNKLKEHGIE
jgi:DNA-binding NtrC family response regulator